MLTDSFIYPSFFSNFAFTPRQDYFTHFEPSQSLGGAKTGDPRQNHLTTCKQNLSCLTCDPSEARTHSGEMTSDLEH